MTVPHLFLERYPLIAETIAIPPDIQGDIEAEHNYLVPILIAYKAEWELVCDEVERGIEDGSLVFCGETGEITKTSDLSLITHRRI
jgi:hypothetical protein